MKDEIKEILNGFKEILDNPTTTDECYDGRIIEIDRSYDLDLDEIKVLLDYITNLQEENERLEISLLAQEELSMNEYYKANNYKSRIDKAIEYIKEWQSFPHTNGSTHNELKNLLNILTGGNEE